MRTRGGVYRNISVRYTYIQCIRTHERTRDIQIYCRVKKLGDKNTRGTGYSDGIVFSDLYNINDYRKLDGIVCGEITIRSLFRCFAHRPVLRISRGQIRTRTPYTEEQSSCNTNNNIIPDGGYIRNNNNKKKKPKTENVFVPETRDWSW